MCSQDEQEYLDEKNQPTSPEKWARAKSAAKSKFAVYPSAYANAWASKKYKSMGGGWKSVSEEQGVAEEVEQINEYGDTAKGQKMLTKVHKRAVDRVIKADDKNRLEPDVAKRDLKTVRKNVAVADRARERMDETAAWQRKEGKRESGGLNQKGVESYRREHPGSKLKTAVTTKPSKLKPGSKAANRRKSFCARMSGMKKRLTSAATARDPDSRINKSLRKWNC